MAESVSPPADALSLLGDIALFRSLTDDQLRRVAALCTERAVGRDTILIAEGRPAEAAYVILRGRVQVDKVLGDEIIKVAELGPGSLLGELTLIDDHPPSATVTTTEPTTLLQVRREELRRLADESPLFGANFYRGICLVLADKLRKSNERIKEYFLINQALVSNETFRQLYVMHQRP